jgi:hypothetical protein
MQESNLSDVVVNLRKLWPPNSTSPLSFRRKRMPNANQIVFIFIFLHEGGPAMCDLILCDQTGTCNM